MAEIILDDAAPEDLIEIWQDGMLDRVWEGFRVVARFPHGGTLRPELAPNLRCYTVGNYVIYFRPRADGIEVARVLHGARDVDAIIDH